MSKWAIASLVCSIAGVTVVPIVGAILGATLAPIAHRDISSSTPPKAGRGYATAGFVLGLMFGLTPALLVSYLQMQEWGPLPFVLALVWTVAVVFSGLRLSRPVDRRAVGGLLAGGLAMTALGVLLLFMLAWLFAAAAAEVTESIGDSLDSAFSDAFDFDCTP
jgi:hypothetical protein